MYKVIKIKVFILLEQVHNEWCISPNLGENLKPLA